jgi:hypothetical protein
VRILTRLNLNFQIEQRLEAEVQRRESCERVCESLHGQLRSVKNEMEAQVCMRVWVGGTDVHACRPHLFACMQKWKWTDSVTHSVIVHAQIEIDFLDDGVVSLFIVSISFHVEH